MNRIKEWLEQDPKRMLFIKIGLVLLGIILLIALPTLYLLLSGVGIWYFVKKAPDIRKRNLMIGLFIVSFVVAALQTPTVTKKISSSQSETKQTAASTAKVESTTDASSSTEEAKRVEEEKKAKEKAENAQRKLERATLDDNAKSMRLENVRKAKDEADKELAKKLAESQQKDKDLENAKIERLKAEKELKAAKDTLQNAKDKLAETHRLSQEKAKLEAELKAKSCLLYTSPSPRD